jgi:hypothetical protein
MNNYQKLFDLFPDARSIAIAGLYGVKRDISSKFQLSSYLYIMEKRDEFDNLYHPRMSKYSLKPDFYLVAVSNDNRYSMAFKKIETVDDVLSSISIAHQVLSIFHSAPYSLGQIEGFLVNSMCSYGLSNPQIAGRNSEFEFFKQDEMFHPFHYSYTPNIQFDLKLTTFFEDVANAYIKTREKKWILSAKKYTSGMNQRYAEDAILDFAVALESLLALDKEQISFKLRLYLSLLIGDTYTERKQIYSDIRAFYGFRSTLIHGSTLSLSDEQTKLITRVGSYLSKALIKTCGKKIKEQVMAELEFLSLLGAPRLIKERTQCLIYEQDIVNVICKYHEIIEFTSYKAYLSKQNDPDDDYTELLVDITFTNGEINTFNASFYISKFSALSSNHKFTYWLSNDAEKGYFYNVTV